MRKMAISINTLAELGLDTDTALGYTGGLERYISAIQRYYNNYEKNRSKVEEFFSAGDYENYMITVHALKSNSRMIGAMDMGKCFEDLEMASRNGDTDFIRAHHAEIVDAYTALIERIRPVGEADAVVAADEISGEEARKVADELLTALDDFDDELATELAKKLTGYPFRPTQKELMKQVIDQIADFMYDEAADLVREVVPAIE